VLGDEDAAVRPRCRVGPQVGDHVGVGRRRDADDLDALQRTVRGEQERPELVGTQGRSGRSHGFMLSRVVGTRHPDATKTVMRLHVHGGLRQLASSGD
jgi:hypothetical protein